VRYNGGVAVGDKEQHKAVLHLPQPLYFSAFCAASVRDDAQFHGFFLCWLSAATQSVASILQIFFPCLHPAFESSPASLPLANRLIPNFSSVHLCTHRPQLTSSKPSLNPPQTRLPTTAARPPPRPAPSTHNILSPVVHQIIAPRRPLSLRRHIVRPLRDICTSLPPRG
jgi:hypothetical protein